MKAISMGAEATVYLDQGTILKVRGRKGYRLAELDDALRKARTRKEAKILKELPVRGPRFIASDDSSIRMQALQGRKLRDVLSRKNCFSYGKELGCMIRALHDASIIHGDLTTSNMIAKSQAIFLIDFGLSYNSKRDEDKAVDLYLLRQALMSRHNSIWEACFDAVLDGYGRDRPAVARMGIVAARGRNKH